ncbi:hypothetical protein MMC19_003111 [Ptychographa xylographoides]|nr:hypothetical protein [Ptychographa xylographoides]
MDIGTPQHPVVLAHGLLGFDELRLAGKWLPGVHYWRGITEALKANGIEVITAHVPASGSIEIRSEQLSENIYRKAGTAWGMLDLTIVTINQLKPPNVKVMSLTTVGTPHRGSSFADYLFERIGPSRLPRMYKILQSIGMETGAFSQLTRKYMQQDFNPRTPDREDIFPMGQPLSRQYGLHFDSPTASWKEKKAPMMDWSAFNAKAFYLGIADMLAEEGL